MALAGAAGAARGAARRGAAAALRRPGVRAAGRAVRARVLPRAAVARREVALLARPFAVVRRVLPLGMAVVTPENRPDC
jgi:hypothetical protein